MWTTKSRSGDLFSVVTPNAPDVFGQFGLGDGDAVLDEHLRLVEIGAELEGDRERHRAIACALARHVEHVFHAVDLLLDGRGDRLRDDLRTRTRIRGAHDDCRRSHLGILCNRKRLVGDRSYENNKDGKDRCEDWPVDEDLGKVHAADRSALGRRGFLDLDGHSWPHSHQTANDDSIFGRQTLLHRAQARRRAGPS